MAGRSGGESFSLERDILSNPGTLVHSRESWRVSRAADVVTRSIKENEGYRFNFERMEAFSPDLGEALQRLKMLPLGAGRRILLLTEGESISRDGVGKIRSYLRSAPPTSSLVIFAADLKKGSLLMKLMSAEGRVIELGDLPKNKYPSFIRDAFVDRGKNVSAQVIRYMLDCLGYDPAAISSAIERIALCHEDKKDIGLEDVIDLIPVSIEHNVFELIDQIASGNLGLSLKILEAMLNRSISQSAEEEMVARIVHLIVRQFRMLLRYRSMRSQRVGDKEFMEMAGLRYGFQMDRLKEQSRRFSEDQLITIMGKLLDMDIAMKSTAMSPRCSLELLLHDICGISATGAHAC